MDQSTSTLFQIFQCAQAAQQRALQKNRRRRIQKKTPPEPLHTPRKRSDKQTKGDTFEQLACQHMVQAGLTLLARQLSCPRGEIDLVMRDRDTLIFVEVRARTRATYGTAGASINRAKQLRLIRTATWHLQCLTTRFFKGVTPACRFDVITFDQGHLQWLRNVIRLEQDK